MNSKKGKGIYIFLTVLFVILALLSLLLSLIMPVMLIVAVGSVLIIYFYCLKNMKAIDQGNASTTTPQEEDHTAPSAKKQGTASQTRAEQLENNCSVPFEADITKIAQAYPKDDLRYNYTDVKCNIIGDVDGLREGSVLLIQPEGRLKNPAGEIVAQIDNKKLADMVNDFFVKEDRFSLVSCRFTKVEEGYLFCNLGFFVSTEPIEDEEESDVDEDENEEL